ncbi:MAG TPA: hypothetical protein DCS93_06965 [Microscillaceae bacterium]|nr:hypothetical protein [Microscillaceae bacterium]
MENSLIITAYFIYLPLMLVLTYFVADTLFKNGQVFMMDIFRGRLEIALATNRLFKVGFYLLSLGVGLFILKISPQTLYNTQNLIEVLSYKTGGFSIYLGGMLFLNLYLLFRGKKKTRQNTSVTTQN